MTSQPAIAPRHSAALHAEVRRQLDALIAQIGASAPAHADASAAASQTARAAHAASLDQLNAYREQLDRELENLENAAEWDVFTIALYGETNAGKSTIIETLRILLEEPGKQAERARFQALAQDTRLDATALENQEQASEQLARNIQQARAAQDATQQQRAEALAAARQELASQQQQWQARQQALGWWQKIMLWFRPLPEARGLAQATRNLEALLTTQAQAQERETAEIAALDLRLAAAVAHQRDSLSRHAALAELQDGAIIGQGHADFTRAARRYEFAANGQKFALIDVPGIEGKEAEVLANIQDAIRQAHAVLYITPKAAPPNQGDGDAPGTLEKIADHLSDQAEVWSVFNKRITNPLALQGTTLTDPDEARGLLELETQLRAQLDSSYRDTISISALPAFYAVADCLLPGSSAYRARAKFRAAMTPEQLLEKSNMRAFCHFISVELCQGYREKIRQANTGKINTALLRGQQLLQDISNQLAQAASGLAKQAANDRRELDAICTSTEKSLRAASHDALENDRIQLRRRIHDDIGQNIGNDAFKRKLRRHTEDSGAALAQALTAAATPVLAAYQQQLEQLAQRSAMQTEHMLVQALPQRFHPALPPVDLKFHLRRNISTVSLASTLGGAALLAWNPAGWILAAIGAATLALSLYNSVRGFLSTSHRQAQQRQAADDNISRMFGTLTESLDGQMETLAQEIRQASEPVRSRLNAPVQSVRLIRNAMQQAHDGIACLRRRLS
ncbi:hypothetical protein [Kerstersia gyiorum]|jgi:hypothetical protein|uniref:hypothetical protein n=1 Tax=Kerstersia gyiorum TaxID=206506 RepID=UPI00242D0FB1|nr:hypothetical protein [Kerstersia gyiorum]MCI1228457.1 GTPase domain-containing protein [Kerstersia gyiorum]